MALGPPELRSVAETPHVRKIGLIEMHPTGSISFSGGAHEHPQCMAIARVRTVPALRLIP
jgi:hypothetical protein